MPLSSAKAYSWWERNPLQFLQMKSYSTVRNHECICLLKSIYLYCKICQYVHLLFPFFFLCKTQMVKWFRYVQPKSCWCYARPYFCQKAVLQTCIDSFSVHWMSAQGPVLKCCSRCESQCPAERDEWLAVLPATYRFTVLMSRRICWEQDRIDSITREQEGGKQKELVIKIIK